MSAGVQAGDAVGRDEVVDRVITAVRTGTGAVLSGVRGCGRSTVVNAAVERVRLDGRPLVRIAPSSPTAAPFGALAPVLGGDLPDGVDASTLSWAADQIVERAGGEVVRPVLVVHELDDLDEASRTVVHQIVAGGRAALLGTSRRHPAGGPAPVAWWRGLVAQIELGPLPREAADLLTERLFGGPVDAATREALWGLARGHPGWLAAVVEAGRDASAWERSGGLWCLTGALDDALDRRVLDEVAALPAEARVVMESLALVDALPIDDAEALGGSGPLAVAERHGLVRTDEVDGELWCAASSRLVAAALKGPLDADTIARRWERIAQVMVGPPRPDPEAQLIRGLAVARSGRLDVAPTADDVDAVVRAADCAGRLVRWDLCVDLADRAWRASGRDDALLLLIGALGMTGDHEQVGALTRDLAEMDLDPETRASHAGTIALSQFHADQADDAFATLAAARRDVPSRVGEIDLMESRLRSFTGDDERALALAVPWLDDDDVEIEFIARTILASDLMNRVRTTDAVAEFDAVLGLVDRDPDRLVPLAGPPFLFRLATLADGGRLDVAVAAAEGIEAAVARGGDPTAHGWIALHLGLCHLRAGRPRTAARWFGEAVSDLRRVQRPGWLAYPAAGLVGAHTAAGDLPAARQALAYWREIPGSPVAVFRPDEHRFVAWLEAAEGRLDAAVATLRSAADSARAIGRPALEAAALHDLSRYGRTDEQMEAADRLERIAGDVDSDLIQTHAARARALVDGDVAVLVAAADAYERSGFTRDAAESWAVASRVAPGPRDAAHARQRVAALLDRCEVGSEPLLSGGETRAQLTEREAEIAELVVSGASRQEVAEHLVVSVRTVDSHLQRIYRKVGVRGRRELAEALGAGDP
ncbi:MAG: hypothetical protein GXY13_13350 [Acidimicrobiales bacterium]|nr:hypothetical protein [Acidimicrobiales bacterium]